MKGLNKKIHVMFQEVIGGTSMKLKLSNSMSTSIATVKPNKELRLNKAWVKEADEKTIRRTIERCVGIETNETVYVQAY